MPLPHWIANDGAAGGIATCSICGLDEAYYWTWSRRTCSPSSSSAGHCVFHPFSGTTNLRHTNFGVRFAGVLAIAGEAMFCSPISSALDADFRAVRAAC